MTLFIAELKLIANGNYLPSGGPLARLYRTAVKNFIIVNLVFLLVITIISFMILKVKKPIWGSITRSTKF